MNDNCPKQRCEEAVAAMYAFIDQELDEVARAVIQAHLEGCPPCFEAFEFEAEIKGLIAQRCKEELPATLYERVRESLRVEVKISSLKEVPPQE